MAEHQANQKFLQLKQQYVQGLPHRIHQIQTAWDRLQHVSWDTKILTLLTHAVHKLTGSGSTFQFPDITDKAGQLEALLKEQLDKPETSAPDREKITRALAKLTRSIDQALAFSSQAASEQPTTEPNEVKRQFTIAIIEDDPSQAIRIQKALAERGYTAHTFIDPEAYSRHAMDQTYQLILLDVSFPQGPLEGLAWLERVRGHVGQHVPVAIMSARTDMVARMRALQAGADIFLTKPLDMNFLARRIHQLHEKASDVCPRVLWVDDDKDLLDYYQSLLTNRGYEVDCLSQSVRLLERIERFQPDVIVLDYQMPGCNGLELARILRQDPRYMTIPIIFVSARPEALSDHEHESIVGNAFFPKPLDDEAFLHCLQAHIVKAQLIAARIDLLSQRHEVGGLQNQDFFIAGLEKLMATLVDAPAATHYLVRISIDNEEYLKARHGMRAIINLTSQVEKYLARQPAIDGVGCQMGGGSFLVLLQGGSPEERRLEDLHKDLNRRDWSLAQGGKSVTVSMGALHLSHAQELDQALSRVETACARAIRAGGARIEWHKDETAASPMGLTNHIKKLLQARAFSLHFQPVMNMESDEALFEGLIRLVDDDQVVYMPSQFLPWLPAGSRGNFYELDRWVIEHAVDSLVRLEGKASASHAVIIKLSSALSEIERMQPFITNVIRSSRVKGKRRIYLALSCPTVLKDIARAQTIFRTMRDLGCGIIIEHVDLSSNIVQMLRDVGAVDFVKLSPELGARAEQTPELDDLLNQLADHFGSTLPVIVTGVEDAKVLSKFWERGIRYFQGYFIQKPGMAMHYAAASES